MTSSTKQRFDSQFFADLHVLYKPEIVLQVLQIQFHIHDLYKTGKSTKNRSSNFGIMGSVSYSFNCEKNRSYLNVYL